jgi:hypothetical protein
MFEGHVEYRARLQTFQQKSRIQLQLMAETLGISTVAMLPIASQSLTTA